MNRLNLGSGYKIADEWLNVDKLPYGQEYVADVLAGLPFPDGHFDYIVAHHTLQMLMYQELQPAFRELHRLLKPTGVIRISVPDVIKAFKAYERGDAAALVIPDSVEATLDAKFSAYVTWYGTNVTLFTYEYLRELLLRAGWRKVFIGAYGVTDSGYDEITNLDSREAESLFVEAFK